MSRFFPKTDAVGEESGKTNHIEKFNYNAEIAPKLAITTY